ncbi:sec-independent translocase [Propionibacteriaceae bacterium Y1685]|uniref:sec-independent translocase n=1 Tax=Microlunatus sp. Y1700 TaxID=3418487 RepID=UPI003B81C988
MFDIGAPELFLLVVAAVIIFGPERLPEFARKAAQVVQYVRGMASNAQAQLSEELGPEFKDLDFRDLNPKAFVKKHLLDEVEPIVADVKGELTSGAEAIKNAGKDAADDFDLKKVSSGGPEAVAAGETALLYAPFDPDAT